MYGLSILAPPHQVSRLVSICGLFLTKTNFTTKNWLLKNSGQSCDSDTKDKSKFEKVFHLKKLAVKNICKDQKVFFECS